ncbi:hypothetical protein ACFL20_05520 [Spirochaetota bacterium]
MKKGILFMLVFSIIFSLTIGCKKKRSVKISAIDLAGVENKYQSAMKYAREKNLKKLKEASFELKKTWMKFFLKYYQKQDKKFREDLADINIIVLESELIIHKENDLNKANRILEKIGNLLGNIRKKYPLN